MAQIIGVQGLGLPSPLQLYPSSIGVPPIPNLAANNALSLAPGQAILVPSGTFYITPGQYSSIQVKDPVTQAWMFLNSYGIGDPFIINSDGENYRITNPTGFPIGAVVNVSGSGYTSIPTVTAGTGGSLWAAVLGPSLSGLDCNSATTSASGKGYGIAPLINIAAPPAPGVQATAVCTISGGQIASFSILNPGGNYTSPPAVVVSPHPFDPNFQSTSTTATTNATVTARTSYAGQVAAVLLTNQGVSVASVPPALSFSGGGGSGAAATAILAQTITNITVTTGGSGYPSTVGISTFGGTLFTLTSGAGDQINSPLVSNDLFPVPRQAQISATQGSGSGVQVGVIVDGGLFTAAPTAYALPGPTNAGSGTNVQTVFALTMGGTNDTIYVTPL